jgi:hypothetical protein
MSAKQGEPNVDKAEEAKIEVEKVESVTDLLSPIVKQDLILKSLPGKKVIIRSIDLKELGLLMRVTRKDDPVEMMWRIAHKGLVEPALPLSEAHKLKLQIAREIAEGILEISGFKEYEEVISNLQEAPKDEQSS